MKHFHPVLALIALGAGMACHATKKTPATAPAVTAPVIAVTPLPIDTPKASTTPVKKAVYHGSVSRSNDIIHTKLEVNFDWTLCRMNGKATLQIKPYFAPVNMLYLDARGMDIKKLEVFEVASVNENQKQGGKTVLGKTPVWNHITTSSYVYENDSLKIKLGKTFTAAEMYYVVIDYVAKPNELKSTGGSNAISEDKGLYFINPTGENTFKMPQIWTQGETQANSVWFPTIDSPNEKMTQEILMTVEERFTTLSNGSLIASTKNANGTRTDHWKLSEPHSPYLAMMAVGDFQKVSDKPWNGKEISFYVEREYLPHAMGIFGDTREMIDFYSTRLGVAYPWPKYSQIVVRDYVSGAMENTSATLHGDFMVYQTTREMLDEKKGNAVIAHELFHQWFGDLVTAESWSNLPLNESFATYGEYLWEEYKNGRDAADYHSMQSRLGYMRSKKEAHLIRFDYNDKEDMFDAISYNKGGQVLHMLRKAVGDDAFFASLKLYLENNRFKNGEIHQLRLAFEEVTGQDLNWFFNQWFLNQGRPKLTVSYVYNASKAAIELSISQNQNFGNTPLYRLPLDVDVYSNGVAHRTRVVVEDVKQTFMIPCAATPELVNVDAERQLVCDLEYKKSQSEYVYQYTHAPLYADRMEALLELQTKLDDETVYALFKKAAGSDRFYVLRNYALQSLVKAPDSKSADLKSLYMQVYADDKQNFTRATALELLNQRFAGDAEVAALNEKALGEASYAICGEGLQGLQKSNPTLAMQKAKTFENESGKSILYPVGALYAELGGDDQIAFFHKSLKYFSGFEVMSFLNSYVKTAKRCTQSSNVIIAAMDLEGLNKGAGRFMKFATLKGMKDLVSAWEGRETAAKAKVDALKAESKNSQDAEKELASISETKGILNTMLNRMKG